MAENEKDVNSKSRNTNNTRDSNKHNVETVSIDAIKECIRKVNIETEERS